MVCLLCATTSGYLQLLTALLILRATPLPFQRPWFTSSMSRLLTWKIRAERNPRWRRHTDWQLAAIDHSPATPTVCLEFVHLHISPSGIWVCGRCRQKRPHSQLGSVMPKKSINTHIQTWTHAAVSLFLQFVQWLQENLQLFVYCGTQT